MKKRVFALVLALMIAMTSIVATSSVYANGTEPTTAIEGHNLSLQDNVYIMYYVTFVGIPAGAETGVLVWTSQQETYAYGTETAKALYDGVSDGYSVYYFDGVSAKMMSQDIYAVSYIKDGNNITYSSLDKYSVLQYAFNKKGSTTIMGEGGTTLGELVAGLLDYGTLAQTYFRYNLDRLANAEYYQLKVKNGTLADGTKSGLYQAGAQVTLNAPTEKDGIPFSCWKDETGATVGNETSVQVTVGAKDQTYTATYENNTTTDPEIVLQNVTVEKGIETVQVELTINNNPGILGMNFKIAYDANNLKLVNAINGTVLSSLSYTKPARFKSGSVFTWYGENILPEDIKDGTIITFEFNILNSEESGTYVIEILGYDGNIIDANLNSISMNVKNGSIVIQ